MPTVTNPLVASLRRVNKESIGSFASMLGRFGVKGLVVVARGYLGPLADRAKPRTEEPRTEEPRTEEPRTEGNVIVGADGATRPAESASTTKPKTVAGLNPTEVAILGLATSKLFFELGELALYNPTLDPAGKQPIFTLDDNGRSPAMSIAHVLAAARVWRSFSATPETEKLESRSQPITAEEGAPRAMMMIQPQPAPRARLYAARSEYYGTAPRYAYSVQPVTEGVGYYASRPPTTTVTQPMTGVGYYASRPPTATTAVREHATSSRGAFMTTSSRCGTCGGSHHIAAPPPTPAYDRCTGGLEPVPRPPDKCTGCGGGCGDDCGCGCSGCSKSEPRTKTYDSEKCPTFSISCETKDALRECVKVALCDLLRCVSGTLCPDGRFDSDIFDSTKNPDIGKQLIDCVGQAACSFMHCLPDALCPPACDDKPDSHVDCLPCGYAVEVVR
jgi:hypothetical protein